MVAAADGEMSADWLCCAAMRAVCVGVRVKEHGIAARDGIMAASGRFSAGDWAPHRRALSKG